jgi:hypothetical protein
MANTLREDLDIIDNLLCGPNGWEIYTILSALRGPDENWTNYGVMQVKLDTTAKVRAHAFPNWAYNAEFTVIINAAPIPSGKNLWTWLHTDPKMTNEHFNQHVSDALAILRYIIPKEDTKAQS